MSVIEPYIKEYYAEFEDNPYNADSDEKENNTDNEDMYLPFPIEEYQIVKNNSKTSYITIGLWCDGRITDKLTIKSNEYRSKEKYINHYSLKRFIDFDDKRWNEYFETFKIILEKAPLKTIYEGVGWIQDNEIFLHGDVIISRDRIRRISSNKEEEIITIDQSEKQSICRFIKEIAETLSNNEFLIITIILYYLLSLLKSRFYYDCKFCPSFALLIDGETGSRKTSTAVPLTNPTGKETFECSFTDSEASISRALKENSNGCTIVDDFKCNSTQNNKKFERVIRLSGDNTTNGKTVDGGKINNEATSGMAVFTGEELPKLPFSSYPRMLIISFNEDTINNDILSILVEKIDIYNSFIYCFIQYIMSISDFSINFTTKVKKKRRMYAEMTRKHNLHDRYPEILSWMSVMFDYVKAFFSNNSIELDYNYSEELLAHIIKQSNKFDRDPVTLFAKAFFELKESSAFKIVNYQDFKSGNPFDLYESDDYYFLRSGMVFKKIENHLSKQNISLSCNETAMRKELYEKKLLVEKKPNLYTHEYKDRNNKSYSGMLIRKNEFNNYGGINNG